MKRLVAAVVILFVFTCGPAFADQGKHGKNGKKGLPDRNLIVVDRSGRAVGPVVEGLTTGAGVFVAAATDDRRAYLINLFPDAFVASGTIRYSGNDCTGDAYVVDVADPSYSFVEVAQIGVDPRNQHLSAFLLDRRTDFADVSVASYWYNGECVYERADLQGARKVHPVKDLGAFSPPFSVSY